MRSPDRRCIVRGRPLPDLPFDASAVIRICQSAVRRQTLFAPRPERAHREDIDSPTGLARLERRLAEHDFRLLGVGSFRVAFGHPSGWVVKCPLHPALRVVAAAEAELAGTLEAPDRRHFPSTWNFPWGVQLQRRARTRSDGAYTRSRPTIRSAARRLGVSDVAVRNIGWHGERWMFIDFVPEAHLSAHLRLHRQLQR